MSEIDEDQLDIELWLSYREGDVAAFTAIYRRHAKTVLRYAWSMLGERTAAEEALQETFLTAWDRRNSSHTVDESLLPWLLSICRNHSRNLLRRSRKHRAVAIDGTEAASLAISDEGVEQLAWISSELKKLSMIDQQVCHLCLVEGYSYADAARILDTTEEAVGKRLQRVRARLRVATTTND